MTNETQIDVRRALGQQLHEREMRVMMVDTGRCHVTDCCLSAFVNVVITWRLAKYGHGALARADV